MAKGVGAVLAVCCLLLTGEVSAEVNYALQQPAYQLGMLNDWPTATPDKAVDGDLTQNFFSGLCIHTSYYTNTVTYPPWWVVQLSRWILPTAVTIYARSDIAGSTRDTDNSYHVGPFWNESLPRVVPTTLLSSDPLGNGRFFFLRSQAVGVSTVAGCNLRLPITTRASGRYFAIKSSAMDIPVDFCEVMVFGSANLLYGMKPTDRFGSLSPGANLSVLTDERETTCWNSLSRNPKFDFQLDFIPILTLTTNFTVAVMTAGSVRPTVSGDATCAPGVYLTISTSANGTCSFVQSVSDGDRNYLSFACTCAACTGLGVALSGKGSLADAVSICEVVAFNG